MKGDTEDKVREALKRIDLKLHVYKPADDTRNWKPCDFFVWRRTGWSGDGLAADLGSPDSTWIEVKDVAASRTFNLDTELRPSQRAGILDAHEIGIPYWLVVWWRSQKLWTISDAYAVLTAQPAAAHLEPGHGGMDVQILASRYGVSCLQATLHSTLKLALLGEIL